MTEDDGAFIGLDFHRFGIYRSALILGIYLWRIPTCTYFVVASGWRDCGGSVPVAEAAWSRPGTCGILGTSLGWILSEGLMDCARLRWGYFEATAWVRLWGWCIFTKILCGFCWRLTSSLTFKFHLPLLFFCICCCHNMFCISHFTNSISIFILRI